MNFEMKYKKLIIIYFSFVIAFNYKRKLNKNGIPNKYKLILKAKLRSSIIWPLPTEIKFKPIMTEKEIKAFCYFMKPNNIYFEFGAGGSTNIASFYKVLSYSVENDAKWHKLLKDNNVSVNYITIDLNPKHLGFPDKNTKIEEIKKYIQAYKKDYNADVILIDGRFRVACALDIFNKIRNDTIILIHDYERKEYHILEKYYLKLYYWDKLACFIKRSNIKFIPDVIFINI
jgi:hypothetical protein